MVLFSFAVAVLDEIYTLRSDTPKQAEEEYNRIVAQLEKEEAAA
jgi:hypothetical protein